MAGKRTSSSSGVLFRESPRRETLEIRYFGVPGRGGGCDHTFFGVRNILETRLGDDGLEVVVCLDEVTEPFVEFIRICPHAGYFDIEGIESVCRVRDVFVRVSFELLGYRMVPKSLQSRYVFVEILRLLGGTP